MRIRGRIPHLPQIVALSLFCVAALAVRGSAAPVYQDTFDGATPNLYRWSDYASGGLTVRQENGKVVLRLPATAQGDTFLAGYVSDPSVRGDFDLQVDYALPTWPTRPGVRVALVSFARNGSGGIAAERVGFGEGEGGASDPDVYLADTPTGVQGVVGTTDRSGTLRMTRVGGLISTYFRSTPTAEWVLIHSGLAPNGDMDFGFRAWSHDFAFGDKEVVVTFDNFRISKGKVILPVEPDGLKAPLAALVPQGQTPPLPARSFRRNQVLPLKLRLLFANKPITSQQVAAPKIVGLTRDGIPVNLTGLDLDDGKYNRNGLTFRAVGKNWVYRLRAKALTFGTYTLNLEMPDGKRYAAAFVLR